MRVYINPAGYNNAARGVNQFSGILNGEIFPDGGDVSADNADVSGVRIRGGDDRAVADNCIESHRSPCRGNKDNGILG
jgi:hypothetical protein